MDIDKIIIIREQNASQSSKNLSTNALTSQEKQERVVRCYRDPSGRKSCKKDPQSHGRNDAEIAVSGPTNRCLGDGKYCRNSSRGDDPPVRRERKSTYYLRGRGSRKNWMKYNVLRLKSCSVRSKT